MKILRLFATLVSLGIAVLGVVGAAFPSLLLHLGQSLLLPPALYGVAGVRVAFGILLFVVAAGSRMPQILRVVGAFLVVAGLLTPMAALFPFDRAITWFSADRIAWFRAVALLPVIGGILLAYAINPGRAVRGDGSAGG